MLYIVPENKPVRRVTRVVSSAHETNNVSSKKHFTYFDPSFEIYSLSAKTRLTSKKGGLKFVSIEDSDAQTGSHNEAAVVLVEVD